MSNPFELNNIPLSRANGINFNYDYKSILDGGYNFFTNKSHLIDGTAGGILLQLSKKELFLIGIRNQLVEFASNQSFDKIMNMEFPSTTAMKTIECVVSRSRFGKLDLPKSVIETANEGKQYVKFTLDGLMHFSKGGLVFGSVFLPEE